MNILGLSCYYHDAAAVLLQDGVVVAASEEERFSRRKHDPRFPAQAIAFCLEQGGIRAADLDYVAFYEKPLMKFERILMTALGAAPRSCSIFREAVISWMKQRLWVKDRIMAELKIAAEKILFVDHHVSHAASAFFCSPFEKAAILTVDGVGEWSTGTMGTATADWDGKGSNSIRLTHEMKFPHSLGLLYSTFTSFLGFEVNEGEYKVMGMAPYGEPRYLEQIEKIARAAADGSLWLDMSYFRYQSSVTESYSRRFLKLFGEPRDVRMEFRTSDATAGSTEPDPQVRKNQYYADIAASVQRFTEETLLKMARHLHRETGLDALCMAGGVALNSMANARILRETPFRDVFIQPAAGDSGGALGAAMYSWHVLLGKRRKFVMEHAYLGRGFAAAEISEPLRRSGARFREFDDADRLNATLVDALTAGKVIGYFQGRAEWGPRALGNRSILADPRRAEMKDIVNRKIKFRETFRPFAPVIPEPCAPRYFAGLNEPARHYPARFMLLVLPWQEDVRQRVPAVDHRGTGRLQTLRPEWNPRYHSLLSAFGEATDVPVLLNTSFNLRGEPIVNSPADALKTFQNSGLDLLVMENFLVEKHTPS